VVTDIRKPIPGDVGRLLLVSAIWGSAFICNSIALVDFSPLAIACWRIVLAALLVWFICRRLSLSIPVDRRSLSLFMLIGVLNSIVPFTLIGWGQLTVNSAITALLIATSPFATLLLSHFMTRDERFSVNRLIGMLVGFAGVVLLFAHEIVIAGNSLLGMLAIMLAASCYSMSSLLIRQLAHLNSLVIVAGSMCTSLAVAVPVLCLLYAPWKQSASLTSLSALLFLAIFPTAIGYVLRARIVQLNGALFMSNAGYLIPLFATLWAWLFLSEVPKTIMWVSMALIFTGIYLGQRRTRRKSAELADD